MAEARLKRLIDNGERAIIRRLDGMSFWHEE